MKSMITAYTDPQQYTFKWRDTLPRVVSSAMSLHNYYINVAMNYRLISYSAELMSNITQTSISLEGYGSSA